MLESGFVEFKLHWGAIFAIGEVLLSDEFSAGGHVWRVRCFPYGMEIATSTMVPTSPSSYSSIVSKSENIKAIFEAFLMRAQGWRAIGEAREPLREGVSTRALPIMGVGMHGL